MKQQQSGETLQSLQNLQQYIQQIQQELQFLKEQTPYYSVKKFVNRAVFEADKLMRNAQKAYTNHEIKQQSDANQSQYQQPGQQQYRAQRNQPVQQNS